MSTPAALRRLALALSGASLLAACAPDGGPAAPAAAGRPLARIAPSPCFLGAPDLVISSATTTVLGPLPSTGAYAPVTIVVTNQGRCAANSFTIGTWIDDTHGHVMPAPWYPDPSPSIAADGYTTTLLSPGASFTFTGRLFVSGAYAGESWVFGRFKADACSADVNDVSVCYVAESNETNNGRLMSIPLSLTGLD